MLGLALEVQEPTRERTVRCISSGLPLIYFDLLYQDSDCRDRTLRISYRKKVEFVGSCLKINPVPRPRSAHMALCANNHEVCSLGTWRAWTSFRSV